MTMNLLKPVKFDKHGALFSAENLMKLIGFELLTMPQDNIITRNVKKMTTTNDEIMKQLDDCTGQLDFLIGKWNASTDKAVNDMKTKVSKIKDVQGQLATSMANVQKTISEQQLERLVNNAEKLATALTTISELNKNPNVASFISLMKG